MRAGKSRQRIEHMALSKTGHNNRQRRSREFGASLFYIDTTSVQSAEPIDCKALRLVISS